MRDRKREGFVSDGNGRYTLQVIARIYNDFPTKFGLPHQSGRIPELRGKIIFEAPYRNPDAVRGLEEFSHIWLIWQFSMAVREGWTATVRPPRLGGNTRMGVFATRSPFRPNSLGLSCVRLEKVELDKKLGPVLYVAGADLADQTPIYDIKPYLAYVESHPQAAGGFTDRILEHKLKVDFPKDWLDKIPQQKRRALLEVLADDPRPTYQEDPDRIYGMEYGEWDIHFRVCKGRLSVCGVSQIVR